MVFWFPYIVNGWWAALHKSEHVHHDTILMLGHLIK